MPSPSVSVVVPAYNCEKTIRKTLEAIVAQDLSDQYEILVIDDGSIDRTADIVKEFKSVRYVYQDNAGPATARNRGVEESGGEVIFFTDSDCVPTKTWIKEMVFHFDDQSVGVVAGSYGVANEENLLAYCIQREIVFRHHRLMPDYPKSFGSYNFCIRREAFTKAGGFDTKYRHASGEDNDLSYNVLKAGYKIFFARDTKVDHHHTESLSKYLYEQHRHGFWRVKMYLDHPHMARGDDYTFWKDIVEIPLVYGSLSGLFLFPFNNLLLNLIICLSFKLLILLQIFYGFVITRSFSKGLYFGLVMFLRSFARSFGFAAGIFSAPFIYIKKYK